jgi:hypothetical protein
VRLQHRAHGVGDLPAAAVADGDVHLGPAAALGAGRRLLQHAGGLGRQQVQRADDAQGPVAVRTGQVGDDALDDPQQRRQLGLRPAEVVGGQQPQRDDLHAGLVAPAEQVDDLARAGPVPLVRVDDAELLGPAPVAVDDDADVLGDGRTALRELVGEPPLVRPVGDVLESHAVSVRP